MHLDPEAHHRRSLRLRGYDYTQAGAYFVTFCTHDRLCVLGTVEDGCAVSSTAGHLVQSVWEAIPSRFPGVELDAFMAMPNHIHGILVLGAGAAPPAEPGHSSASREPGVRAQSIAQRRSAGDEGAIHRAPTLGEIIRAFKATSTRLLHANGLSAFAWQRNYYEHVIRDEASLGRIRRYIAENPLRWLEDVENPINVEAKRGRYLW